MAGYVKLALLATAALLAINILLHIHRQGNVLSRLQVDFADQQTLQQRVEYLNRELEAAKREIQQKQLAGEPQPQLITHNPQLPVTSAPPTPCLDAQSAADQQADGWYQRVEDIPAGSTVWVSFVNGDEKYREMMLNWAFHLRQLHVPHVVFAFDDVAANVCADNGIPYMRNTETLVSGDFRADFTKFRKMGSNKPLIVTQLLEQHSFDTVIISDVDTVWLRNPTEFLERHPTADVLISTDCLSHWVEAAYDPASPVVHNYHRCGHMPGSSFGRAFNTGIIIFRNRPATLEVLRKWREALTDPDRAYAKSERGPDFAITDQLAFNIILEENITPIRTTPDDERVIWAMDNRLRLMALPVLLFNSGHVFFYQHLPALHDVEAYVVHCTFQRHHTAGKRARLREEGLWLVEPPEYYEGGSYMAYDNDVVEYLAALQAKASGPMPDLFLHLHAMSYQLAAMRDAFAIARALNRTLVLPRFVCHCDQDWYASILKECRVDSSDLQTPFVCPLDVLINPGNLDSSRLPYRMDAFLRDRRTPPQILQSREPVYVDTNAEWVAFMQRHNLGASSYVAAGATADTLRQTLQYMQHVRLLTFKGLRPGVFGGFGSADADADFDGVMQRVVGDDAKWCCSGEQPIDVKWITWWYALPRPLAEASDGDWSIPKYDVPQHCRQIANGDAGSLNEGFVREANHPCNFLTQGIVLPDRLSQVLPSIRTLEVV